MSNPIQPDNNKPHCVDCQHVQTEIYDLKNFVAYWFDVFARRFDDQDKNLAIIVQSIGDGERSASMAASASLAAAAEETTKDPKYKTARNVWSFLENETTKQAQTERLKKFKRLSNIKDEQIQSKNGRNSFTAAVEVEGDDDMETDIKPDINVLRQSLVTETNKLEYFSPSLGLKTNSISPPKVLVKSATPATATAEVSHLSPITDTTVSEDLPGSTASTCTAAIQQRIKDIELKMKNKQYIVVREKAATTGKMTVINRCTALNMADVLHAASTSVSEPKASETEVKQDTPMHKLPSTALGTLFRRPLSEEAKKRLDISKPKSERVITAGPNVSDGTAPMLRLPSEEAKRRLQQMEAQRSQQALRQQRTGTTPQELLNAKKRLSLMMKKGKAKKPKKHEPWSASSESAESPSSTGSADEESTNVDDEPSLSPAEKESEVKKSQCPVCKKEFSTVHGMLRHKKQHVFKCASCGKKCPSEESLSAHTKTVHGKTFTKVVARRFFGRFKCKYCEEIFTDKKELNEHQANHYRDGDRFKCKLCENSYNWFNNLVRHFKQAHDGRAV